VSIKRKDPESVRASVRDAYADVARERAGCCDAGAGADRTAVSQQLGYDEEELAQAPGDANLGLGCGNPTAMGSLRPGEVVLDLGSGGGLDAFIASRQVGPSGRVIGVDMTPDMIALARRNAEDGGYANVEFREGTIEALPVNDASVDVILSNCVINLSPEKQRVFREAFRVLRPGGRLMVSDIVLDRPLPEPIRSNVEAYVGCIAGAELRADYLEAMALAGFTAIEVTREGSAAGMVDRADPMVARVMQELGLTWDEVAAAMAAVKSVHVSARRPA
jgi:SAM-dependent methyltransferase